MEKERVLVGDDMPKHDEPTGEVVDETPKETPKETPEESPKVYAGKFKTPEDLESSYSQLEKKLGEQGNKIGSYEKERSVLLSQLEQMQAQNQKTAPTQEAADDFDAQLADVARQIEEGELSIGEGIKRTALISAQMGEANTLTRMQQKQKQDMTEGSKRAFAEQHPDFFEMQQSGILDEVMNKYPGFHDPISAYFEAKADMAETSAQAAIEAARKEAYEAGKAEMAKLADGDKNTQKVLQKPGGNNSQEIGRKTGPLKPNELRSSGLAALQRARGG